jgi:NADH:ubiquinone oxidoreductase subunit E
LFFNTLLEFFQENEIGVVHVNEEAGDNTEPSLTFFYGHEIKAHLSPLWVRFYAKWAEFEFRVSCFEFRIWFRLVRVGLYFDFSRREIAAMTQELHPSHPDIDPEMWKRIDAIVSAGSGVPGSVIAVLRECQDVAGYLPVELIDYIAVGLNLSRSEVFGVASFYALFSLKPKGRNLVKVCMGTACYVKGIKEVINRVENHYGMKQGGSSTDRRFSLEAVRCLGACGLAPVMVVNSDTYGDVKADKIVQILDKYE